MLDDAVPVAMEDCEMMGVFNVLDDEAVLSFSFISLKRTLLMNLRVKGPAVPTAAKACAS